MSMREAVGRAIGGVLSPIIWLGSLTRGARVFHPDGVVYSADVKPLAEEGDVGELAQRLAGPALVRLSPGIMRWRPGVTDKLPDVLGVAVRFRTSPEITPLASAGDQDLLFLSFRHFWMLPISPLLTNVRDYLANDYYAQLPFKAGALGKVTFRLVPLRAAEVQGDRREKLERTVRAGLAVLRLEVKKAGRRRPWVALADLVLREKVNIDQQALLFDPFRAGQGIMPSGLIQAARLAMYMASYWGRQLAARQLRADEEAKRHGK